jgi:hypothetical protein
MVPDGIREKFDLYRKWFKTLLIEEFLNLPTQHQEQFLVIVQKFLDDCKKVHEEGKSIKERIIEIKVKRIAPELMKNKGTYFVFGTCNESEEEIKIVFPIKKPQPKIGDKIYHTVYSMGDETIWYSSKEELLKAIA